MYLHFYYLQRDGNLGQESQLSQVFVSDHENVQHEVTVESSNKEIDSVETELIQDNSVVYESVQCTLVGHVDTLTIPSA